MKKYLAFLLVLSLLWLCTGAALSETTDYSTYSDDAMIEMLAQIQAEIVARNIEKTATLNPGRYLAGKDLPVGSYVYSVVQADVERYGDGFQFGIVYLRAADDPEDKYPSKLYENVDNTEAFSVYISLEEGDEFYTPVSCTLTISAGAAMFK